METLPKASLSQMLASIPPQGLDRKVSDIHLADIATALIDWKQVCTNLGIKEADEVAIEEENKTADARRFCCCWLLLLLLISFSVESSRNSYFMSTLLVSTINSVL